MTDEELDATIEKLIVEVFPRQQYLFIGAPRGGELKVFVRSLIKKLGMEGTDGSIHS